MRYNPRDISRIFVRRPNGHWIETPYRDLRWPAVSLWEYERARKLLLVQGRKEFKPEMILRTAVQQREIVENAVKTTKLKKLYHPSLSPVRQLPKNKAENKLTGIDLSRPDMTQRKP